MTGGPEPAPLDEGPPELAPASPLPAAPAAPPAAVPPLPAPGRLDPPMPEPAIPEPAELAPPSTLASPPLAPGGVTGFSPDTLQAARHSPHTTAERSDVLNATLLPEKLQARHARNVER